MLFFFNCLDESATISLGVVALLAWLGINNVVHIDKIGFIKWLVLRKTATVVLNFLEIEISVSCPLTL